MPSYSNSAFQIPKFLTKGVPTYLYGSFNNLISPSQMRVTQVAITSNVATVSVVLWGGAVPAVGSLISVAQTATASGSFNVSRVALTGVTIDSSTGVGTVTFALTHADVVAAADTGLAIVDVPETSETLAAGSSVPVAVQATDSQRTLTTAVTFPTLPTAVNVYLQEAIRDIDSEYTTIGTAAAVSGGVQGTGPIGQFTLTRGNFYRFKVANLTGSGSIVAKVL